MTKTRNPIEIVRIPNEGPNNTRPQTFPRMPQLYLELIENKTKIQSDMIGVPYQHVYATPEPEPLDSIESVGDRSAISSLGGSPASIKSTKSFGSIRSEHSVKSVKSSGSSKTNDVAKRLEDMLGDDDSVSTTKSDKYKRHRDRSGNSIEKKLDKVAPSYAELEAQGAYVPRQELRELSTPPKEIERNQDDMKRELLFKFELLRKSYPDSSIPEYSVHTDYNSMLMSYEDCVRRLSLDSSVESYKQYLIYAFMALEFGLGKYAGIEMDGFTQQQIVSMSSYEKLLIELGEKSYVPEGSEWSVEVRLLGLVLMNTAFFVVSKMIISRTNTNLMDMMNGMMGKAPSKDSGDSASSSKSKGMKPPDIDLSEL